jgi:hypothetical protein
MPIKIECPHCERSLAVTASDAGQAVVCSACGNRVAVPFLIALQPQDDDTVDVDPRFAVRQWLESSGSRKQYRIPVIHATPQFLSRRAIVVTAALVCIGLIGAASWFIHRAVTVAVAPPMTSSTPDAEAEQRKTISTMLNRADDFAITGQWDEADRAYDRLEEFVAAVPTSDPLLLEQLNHEALRHKAVRDTLALQKANAPTPPSSTSSPPVVAETPAPATSPPQSPTTVAVASASISAPAQPPAQVTPMALHVVPLKMPPPDITDEQIGVAIRKAADWLVKQFDPAAHELRGPHDKFGTHNGLDALCVYALMQAGLALPNDDQLDIQKPFMHQLITKLTGLQMEERIETYGRGLRATALALTNRKEFRPALQMDVNWLLHAHKDGAYGYGDSASKGGQWDNSNTQYGQLGVWSAAEAGIEVSPGYWKLVEKHWNDNQVSDGSWGYMENDTSGRLSMTAAGVASLFVAHDYLEPADLAAKVGRPPFTSALAKGLQWFESGDNILEHGEWWGYTLYGVERVGLASGFKYFGTHDWYRELAQEILKTQDDNGSFGGGDPMGTSYILLFLARGRHPIVMNKLRFDGFWANRSRDVANLTRFASHELERPLNWQVVPVDRPWQDWADSPILYLASHQAVQLTEMQIGQIRRFVEAGGMLFTHADGGQKAFNDFAADLAHQLFPAYPLTDAKPDDELYSTLYVMKDKPRLQIVSNGARVLMIHSPADLTTYWQQRSSQAHPASFDLGVNLFLYASGKVNLQNRLASPVIPDPPQPTGGVANVAMLRYGPAESQLWMPEPEAWLRFNRWFGWQTSCSVNLSPTPMAEANAATAPLAELSGAAAYKFTAAQAKATRNYVDGGGTLLIECTGGSAAFADSAGQLLAQAFPDASLKVMPASHPLLARTIPGMEDLPTPRMRSYVEHKLGSTESVGTLEYLMHGRGRVIFSKLDITEGMLGTRMWPIMGYDPNYALSLMKNLVIWTAAGAPEQRSNAVDARQ